MKGFAGDLVDRQLIRERMGIYSDATFQRDRDGWLACWDEEGVWSVMGKTFAGRAALAAQWDVVWSRLDRMMFFTELGAVVVDGDCARARCYCREIVHYRDGSIQKVVGLYEDELVRQGGDWLFARRDYRLISNEGRLISNEGRA